MLQSLHHTIISGFDANRGALDGYRGARFDPATVLAGNICTGPGYLCVVLSVRVASGLMIFSAFPSFGPKHKPSQFSTLGFFFGGYHRARLLHFFGMCGLLAFIPGHLILVALHGWDNFQSMLTVWKTSQRTLLNRRTG